ncbi:MAG: DUF962 domain-containing protein [Alphaproteobacteria bacterium]|nr:MAG: DUF962 domain-containing protein [Alphaproteobacteria bacterium]
MTTEQVTERANRRIDALLSEYGESHRNPQNKFIHWIAVPVIFWTVVAILWSLPVPDFMAATPYLNWASITLVLTVLYYFSLSWTLALGMVLFSGLCFWIAAFYEQAEAGFPLWQFALLVFVIAWIFQFIGHKIEGRKPSFFKDIQFLLIGPAWLMSFIYKKLGLPV